MPNESEGSWPMLCEEFVLSNYMKVVREVYAKHVEISLFNEAGDLIGFAELSLQSGET